MSVMSSVAPEFLKSAPLELFKPGDIVLPSTERATDAFFVESGLIKIDGQFRYTGSKSAFPRTVSLLEGPCWLGLENSEGQRRAMRHTALVPTEGRRATLSELRASLTRDELIGALDQYAAEYIRLGALGLSRHATVRVRMLAALFHIRKRTDREEIPLTLDDLAGLAGTSRALAGKALKELEREDLVETGYRVYWIADASALFAAIQGRA